MLSSCPEDALHSLVLACLVSWIGDWPEGQVASPAGVSLAARVLCSRLFLGRFAAHTSSIKK
jgi:hypothetical protein